jgi:tRNA(Ile)-lysidine synthase
MNVLPLSLEEARKLFAALARFPRVALAVSGGPDSVALMLLAAEWRHERADGPDLSVLTVDHGLRADSRDEALMVGRMANALGIPHTILTWEGVEIGASLQAKARAARYDLMAAHCCAHDISTLVTGHHLDDQAETLLMRLKRGSGLDGLAAIPAEGAWAGITLLRPLLDVPKVRLVATLEERGITFATDPSNTDSRFERACIRGDIEALAGLGLTPEALALSARRLRRARAALDHAAHDFLLRHSEMSEAGYAVLGQEALRSAPQEIALRALACLIGAVGGGEDPIRLGKLEALLAALTEDPAKPHTLGRCRIEPRSGRLGIFRELRKEGLPVLELEPGGWTLWDNRFKVELGRHAPAPVTLRALGDAGLKALRERSYLPQALPPLAARTLPACWRGEALLGLPMLAGPSWRHNEGLDCRATFLRGTIQRRDGTPHRV